MIHLTLNVSGEVSVAEIEPEAVHGPWALHEGYQYPGWWGITHIPTGLSIAHLPKPEYEYDAVLRLLYGLPEANQFATKPPKTIEDVAALRKANDYDAAADEVKTVLRAWRTTYGTLAT